MRKILIGLIVAVLLLVGANSVLGATFKSPAEIYAELKGISVEEAYAVRQAGSGFCLQTENPDISEEFRAQMLENRKAVIQEKVIAGELTQEQADSFIANMEENMANRDGSLGRGGMGFGQRAEGYLPGGRGNRGGCWGAQGL
ncbi:MAG: hypothetical protein APF84_05120 [Gracilibacter sp. BRH_c7a]|nr:MAG: hypothetical protein APF84_05120 [Gracilibacter sp. BRH_c7a]